MEPMSCAFQSLSSSPQIFVASLVLMFICFTLVLISIQNEDVSIVVVGILGKNWDKKKMRNKMKDMAGKKGQVFSYRNFDSLTKRFNEVLDALCRKYFVCLFVFFFFHKQISQRQRYVKWERNSAQKGLSPTSGAELVPLPLANSVFRSANNVVTFVALCSHKRVRWSKICVLLGHSSEQHSLSCPFEDSGFVPAKKVVAQSIESNTPKTPRSSIQPTSVDIDFWTQFC